MLLSLNDEGHMEWQCTCGKVLKEHHSHDEVYYTGPHVVGLPTCDCGARTFLKVHFTDDELAAPNMIDQDGIHTESHAASHRHMALAQHLRAMGKGFSEDGGTPPVAQPTRPSGGQPIPLPKHARPPGVAPSAEGRPVEGAEPESRVPLGEEAAQEESERRAFMPNPLADVHE